MRILRADIEVAMLTMFHPRQEFPLGGTVAFQFVRDDHAGHVCQSLEQLAEELPRGFLGPTALHKYIQHSTVLIDSPPQVVSFALNREKHLVQVPLVPRLRLSATELIGIGSPKLAAPLADGFIRHDHPAGEQEFFDITVAQAEAVIEPHAMADAFYRKAVVLVTFRSGGRGHPWLPNY
jgi:hypothetical protein